MSDLREALQRARGALADIASSDDMTLSLARKKARHVYDETALSAEPAQEMTDADRSMLAAWVERETAHAKRCNFERPSPEIQAVARLLAADRASRLPELTTDKSEREAFNAWEPTYRPVAEWQPKDIMFAAFKAGVAYARAALPQQAQAQSERWTTARAFASVKTMVKATQKSTARMLGISEQYLSDMLNGRREPDKLLELFGFEREVRWVPPHAASEQDASAPQGALQGGLSNDQLRAALRAKLPNGAYPEDEWLTPFALGVEVGAALAASPAPAPQEPSEPLGEVVGTHKIGPYDLATVAWAKGIPPVGTKLYASPASSAQGSGGEKV